MKKHLLTSLIALLLCIGTAAQAQHRFTLGWVAGAGTTATKESDRIYNTAQYSMSAGVDMGFQVWRRLYLTGRVEFQKRYYEMDPARSFLSNGEPFAVKDAILYQAGLAYRGKYFYASAGPTFSDNLNGRDFVPPLSCGFDINAEQWVIQDEYYNSWGMYANIGFLRPLTPYSNVLFELGFLNETSELNTHSIDLLQILSLRMGVQYQL